MTDSDSFYHRLFSHPEIVVELLQEFLDPELLKELDLSGLRRVNTKFTAPKGQRRRGDMVWEIPIHGGGSLFLLLILEFQSTIDEWMSLRFDVYTGLLYQQLVDERKLKAKDGLPPVLPILLYNGEPNWNATTSLRKLIRLRTGSPLWKYQPEMRYYVVDEGLFPNEELKNRKSLLALLFRLEHPVNPKEVVEIIRELAEWFRKHPDGPPVKRLFNEFLDGSLKRFRELGNFPHIPDELLEVVNMLSTRVEQWSRDIEQRGWIKGLQEGEQIGEQRGEREGRKEEATNILLRQLTHRFGDVPNKAREKIAGADLATLEEWSLRILDAQSLEDVFRV